MVDEKSRAFLSPLVAVQTKSYYRLEKKVQPDWTQYYEAKTGAGQGPESKAPEEVMTKPKPPVCPVKSEKTKPPVEAQTGEAGWLGETDQVDRARAVSSQEIPRLTIPRQGEIAYQCGEHCKLCERSEVEIGESSSLCICLLYTSDAADE